MFSLDRSKFRSLGPSSFRSFVNCWERYYHGAVSVSPGKNQGIDYVAELNLSGALTSENVARLLRFKDPRILTHPRVSGGENVQNPRVIRVLNEISKLHDFAK